MAGHPHSPGGRDIELGRRHHSRSHHSVAMEVVQVVVQMKVLGVIGIVLVVQVKVLGVVELVPEKWLAPKPMNRQPQPSPSPEGTHS